MSSDVLDVNYNFYSINYIQPKYKKKKIKIHIEYNSKWDNCNTYIKSLNKKIDF